MKITREQTNYPCLPELKGEDQKRLAKIAKYLCAVGVALALSAAGAYGQNTAEEAATTQPAARDVAPPDCDFGRLGLQVARVEVLQSIESGRTVWTPKAGRQIVVVHLKGKGEVPEDFAQASNWSDIQAIYGRPDDLGFAIEPACAFVLVELMGGGKMWAFSQASQGAGLHAQVESINGHRITSSDQDLIRVPNGQLTVAFALPVSVKSITIRFPVAAKNAAGGVVQEIK